MIKTLTNLLKQDKEKFVVPKGVQDNSSVIMNSTEQSQDSFCSGKELKNGTNE